MKTTSLLPLLFAALLPLAACDRSPVLVTVGGEKIRESDLDLLARVNPRLKARLSSPAGKEKIVENYVEQELLYQESNRRGLQRRQDVAEKLDLYKKIIIAQALVDDELDRRVREYYDNHKDEFERVKLQEILIRTQPSEEALANKKKPAGPRRSDEAALKLVQAVEARLKKGEAFDAVARDVSEDDRTSKTGGDLGYITIHDKRLERWGWLPLADKAFAMKKDEISDPIKTKDGYHLIKIVEEKTMQPFDEADGSIRFRIQADVRTVLLDNLKKKYKVKYAKAMEPPAAPMMPPPMPPATMPAPAPETAPATKP